VGKSDQNSKTREKSLVPSLRRHASADDGASDAFGVGDKKKRERERGGEGRKRTGEVQN
jgi:hypothetical protein